MVARGRRYRRRVNRFNRVLVGLQKAGLKLGAVQILTTTGRRTGQPRRVPVGLDERDGQRYLAQAYPNARALGTLSVGTSCCAFLSSRSAAPQLMCRTTANPRSSNCRRARADSQRDVWSVQYRRPRSGELAATATRRTCGTTLRSPRTIRWVI